MDKSNYHETTHLLQDKIIIIIKEPKEKNKQQQPLKYHEDSVVEII